MTSKNAGSCHIFAGKSQGKPNSCIGNRSACVSDMCLCRPAQRQRVFCVVAPGIEDVIASGKVAPDKIEIIRKVLSGPAPEEARETVEIDNITCSRWTVTKMNWAFHLAGVQPENPHDACAQVVFQDYSVVDLCDFEGTPVRLPLKDTQPPKGMILGLRYAF